MQVKKKQIFYCHAALSAGVLSLVWPRLLLPLRFIVGVLRMFRLFHLVIIRQTKTAYTV